MEDITMNPETTETTEIIESPETEVAAIPDTDFEKLYKSEKKRNKAFFFGGTAVGAVGMFFWIKKMQPGLKALKERKKLENAEKKAEKKAKKDEKKANKGREIESHPETEN